MATMTDDTRRAEELPHPTIGDLAMLVARLVRQVRKHDPKNDVAEKAMGYLRRHDLQGSVLRETHEKMTAAALRAARDEGLEEAAKVADQMVAENELAMTNPTSRTLAKCLPYMADDCRRIAAAIRSLKSKGGE